MAITRQRPLRVYKIGRKVRPMFLRRLLAVVSCLVGPLGFPAALAADLPCTSLLQRHVLDLRDTRSFEDRVSHVKDVVCRREYADIEAFKRLNDHAGGGP